MKAVNRLDEWTSSWIHEAVVKPKFLEILIMPFAALFQPLLVPVIGILMAYYVPKHSTMKYSISLRSIAK